MRRREKDPDAVETAVIEEGRLMARVRHPNVVTVYGAERIDGRAGLWMEFVEGQTLEEELRDAVHSRPARSSRSGSICPGRWTPSIAPACSIAISRHRTSCGTRMDAFCWPTSAPVAS